MRDNEQRRPEAEADGIIEGRNAVIEALRAGTTMDKIYLAKGETDKTLGHIASKARAQGIVVVEADRRKLDGMSRTHAHQGVIALAAVREYVSVDDILADAAAKNESPLIVVCDEISDPHNLGAIIRTAECAGAHGLIVPMKNAAPVNAEAVKASAGALNRIPVHRAGSIRNTLKYLSETGMQIVAATEKSRTLIYDADLGKPTVIVMGSEDKGISKEVLKLCDVQLAVPIIGSIESLNVSAAAAVLLFEAVRQRIH